MTVMWPEAGRHKFLWITVECVVDRKLRLYVQPSNISHVPLPYVLLHKLRKSRQRCHAFLLLPCWWIKTDRTSIHLHDVTVRIKWRLFLKNFKTLKTFHSVYGTGRRNSSLRDRILAVSNRMPKLKSSCDPNRYPTLTLTLTLPLTIRTLMLTE